MVMVQQPMMVMQQQPMMQQPVVQLKGKRQTPPNGACMRGTEHSIHVLYDAEIRPPPCMYDLFLCLMCCSDYDEARSYLYLRENSLEMNTAYSQCCGLIKGNDNVRVQYFDKKPFAKYTECCGCTTFDPELKVLNTGCMCCWINCGNILQGCCKNGCMVPPELLVVSEFKYQPFPCCCCANEVLSGIGNCFGGCGDVVGNPIIYRSFYPQPVSAKEFCDMSIVAMNKSPRNLEGLQCNPLCCLNFV